MNIFAEMSVKKGVMLGISNKTLPALVDRMTIFISSSEHAKAKQELKEIKSQIAEMERLLMEAEKLEKGASE
jgi:DNA gyrase/topoisomerase IV subunit A